MGVVNKSMGDLKGKVFEAKGWCLNGKGIRGQMKVENQLDDTVGVFLNGVKRVGFIEDGGLFRSDVIKAVNKTEISGLSAFTKLYSQLTKEGIDKILLTIKRGGGTRFIVVTVDKDGEEELNEEL